MSKYAAWEYDAFQSNTKAKLFKGVNSLNKERMLKNLFNMIRIDSVSLQEKDMANWLVKYFTEKGEQVYADDCGSTFAGNSGNLMIYIKGSIEGEALCFGAHMDTVEPGNGINPVIKGNYIESDTKTILAADDKAGIAAILEAYEYIKENNKPHRDLYLLFTVCEEIGMLGAKNFDCSKLGTKNIIIIDATGPAGKIAYAAPAKEDIKVKFLGKKAHAGIEPEKGVSAICIAGEAISNMTLGRIDSETTANLGRIEGGGQTNIVTDEVYLTAEVRSHNVEKLNEVVAEIKAACEMSAAIFGGKVEITSYQDYPNMKLNRESFIYNHCVKAFEKENIQANPVVIGGGSDANVLSANGFDCAIISCGMEKVHTVEERLNIEELYITSKVIFNMMTE
jgi:tripeptide aminopeptidase